MAYCREYRRRLASVSLKIVAFETSKDQSRIW
jgi:hypothetical protein